MTEMELSPLDCPHSHLPPRFHTSDPFSTFSWPDFMSHCYACFYASMVCVQCVTAALRISQQYRFLFQSKTDVPTQADCTSYPLTLLNNHNVPSHLITQFSALHSSPTWRPIYCTYHPCFVKRSKLPLWANLRCV